MRIGIIVAMGKELRLLLPLIEDLESITTGDGFTLHIGQIHGHDVAAMQCGIGKVNAALGTKALIEAFAPDLVVNTGVAGGTGQGARIGEVIVGDEVVYHDVWCGPGTIEGEAAGCPSRFKAAPQLLGLKDVKHGMIASGDIFVSRKEEVDKILSVWPEAIAVDMESAAIAQTCYLAGVDFGAVRVVSDTPGAAENISQYENFWEDAPEATFGIVKQLLANLPDESRATMKKIPSFTIDHNRLLRGIYVSRLDITPRGDTLTTFDIRMTEPNRQAALSPQALHAMEHIAATFLRNHPVWGSRIVYWGPMGCCTGNYLILNGVYESKDIVGLMRETMEYVAAFEGAIPGATPKDCGNYTYMDLNEAKIAARCWVDEVLADIRPENLTYPV